MPVVEALRGLLFYPTLYEGFEYSRHCIYTGAAPNQNSLQLAKYSCCRHYGNRFLLVGSNYIYPYESNRVMADFVAQAKGKVLDEIYVPLHARPRISTRSSAGSRRRSPDVIFSTVVGQCTSMFYEAYRRAGFDPNKMPIASLTTSEAEVAEMSPEAAEGHITAAPFFETLSSRRRGVSSRVQAQIRRRCAGDGRRGGRLFSGPSGDARAGALPDPTIRNGCCTAVARLRIRRAARTRPDRSGKQSHLSLAADRAARRTGRFQIVWNPGVRVKPDPYCVVQSLDDWSVDDLRTVIHWA